MSRIEGDPQLQNRATQQRQPIHSAADNQAQKEQIAYSNYRGSNIQNRAGSAIRSSAAQIPSKIKVQEHEFYTIYEIKHVGGQYLLVNNSKKQIENPQGSWKTIDGRYEITEVVNSSALYSGKQSYRKAHTMREVRRKQEKFNDEFRLDINEFEARLNPSTKKISEENERRNYSLRSIYEIYDKEFYIFDHEFFQDTFVEYQQYYPSFIPEFSMIDRQYLKTIFITQNINKEGYYKYFVRRNGEYYVQYIDDIIPVHESTQQPIWGLNVKEPWKLLLLKAWLKEKKGVTGVIDAQPFEFIEAFGIPGYRAISIKKQVDYLVASRIGEAAKKRKQQRIPLNMPGFITVGKTRNSQKVKDLGLQVDRAGYRILAIQNFSQNEVVRKSQIHPVSRSTIQQQIQQDNIYKVRSPLISHWVGSYTVVTRNEKLRSTYSKELFNLNIERDFVATYKEISEVFSKFYISPEYLTKFGNGPVIQDSYSFQITQAPLFFQLDVVEDGFLTLNIDLPFNSYEVKQRGGSDYKRYAPIKYFMGRVEESNKPYVCKYYDGDYVRSYHHSNNRFLNLMKGRYFIYVKIDNKHHPKAETFAININSNAKIQLFKRHAEARDEEISSFIQSTLLDYSKRFGLRTYINKEEKDTCIYLCNTFDELGFGLIVLKILKPSNGTRLALTASETLQEKQLQLCREAYDSRARLPYTLVATIEEEKILILQKTDGKKYGTSNFPPDDLVEFFEIAKPRPKSKVKQ